jgi:CheY-like chemotaxis protein
MPTILLIDDDQYLLSLLRTVLAKRGYQIIAAVDGASGLAQARELKPDLIILDIIMPGIDGFEVARQLGDDPALAHIPIMALTAYAMANGRKRAADAGLDEFVTKPFRIDDLVGRVARLTAAA